MNHPPLPHICDYSLQGLPELLIGLGEPAYRANQVLKWVYQKRVAAFDRMQNISNQTQRKLAGAARLDKLKIHKIMESKYGDAVKFAFDLADGAGIIESVLLYDDNRRTACISSHLGCA
ncbi:MAG: hypothetical protein PHC61_19115, partial [Chitinivibrionales bacterium]|nr:hypothetical protein [Chitinivibrionales bacterium]